MNSPDSSKSQPTLGAMTIAITGASGFIGARVAELLATADSPPRLKLLARRQSRNRNHTVADLQNPASVKAALQGCDAVIHCAFDFQDMSANLRISSILANECVALGARLVHVSTASVHEPFPDGELDESVDARGGGTDYKQVKLAIENDLISQVRDKGLDLVILQPTVVYGPFGRAWTDSPVRELLTGTVTLPDEGSGLCNAVFVDDVCQAVIAALTATLASGERILVSGPSPVTWRDFYRAYQDMLRVDALELQPVDVRSTALAQERGAADADQSGHSSGSKLKGLITKTLGSQVVTRLNMYVSCLRSLALGGTIHRATGAKLALFRARCDIRIDKAKRLLGYEPRFDLTAGMRMTAPYVLRTYGLLARLRAYRGGVASAHRGRDAIAS